MRDGHGIHGRRRHLSLIARYEWAALLGAVLGSAVLSLAAACGPTMSGGDGGDLGTPDFGAPPEGGRPDVGVRDAGADTGDGAVPGCPVVDCDPTASAACGADAGLCVLRDSAPASCESRADSHGHEGDACRMAGDCLDTLGCFATAGGGGLCMRVCCPAADGFCGPVAHCGGPAVLVSGATSVWGRCVTARTCDVLTGMSCDPGEGCYIVSERGDTDCRPIGTVGAGGSCGSPNDCVPGFVCTGLGDSRCVRICSLGDAGPPGCAPTEGVCQAYPYSPHGTGVCTLTTG